MKNVIYSLMALTAMVTISACSGNSSPSPGPDLAGTSSGGGSFGDESSMKLLNWSKSLTAASIRRANPAIFVNLPKGWTQERLATLIETTKAEPRTEAQRYDRELMFDYRIPKTGEPTLVATALFFRAHSAIPVNSSYQQNLEPYIREIRIKLLHEAAHVMGIGLSETSDIKARAFAAYLAQIVLSKNNILCETTKVPNVYPGNVEGLISKDGSVEAQDSTYLWAINRPTGFALQALKSPRIQKYTPYWLNRMRSGESISLGSFALYTLLSDDGSYQNAEYSRWYSHPMDFRNSTNRTSAQYYKGYQLPKEPNGRVTLTGSTESFRISVKNSSRSTCLTEERIEIPLSSKGTFTSKITFSESCGLYDWSQADPMVELSKPQNEVSFEASCREHYDVIENMDEFFGEDIAFTNPELKEWMRNYETLD